MRMAVYILLLLLFSVTLRGENFIIDKYKCSTHLYTNILKHIFLRYNNKEIALSNEGNIIRVSYADIRQVSFHRVPDNPHIYTKRKGKYIANLYIKKDEQNIIVAAHFIITRKNRKIADISLTHP